MNLANIDAWYVVQTQPHAETKASLHLVRQGFATYLPRYLKRRRHARRVDTVADAGAQHIAQVPLQRVVLGQAVVADEGDGLLDGVRDMRALRHDVRQILHHLRARGCAVFLNSHLLTEVEMVCDRVAMVDRGRVIASGTLDDLLGGKSCRVRVTGLDVRQRGSLHAFGELDDDGEWITVRGLEPERVPELVDEIVRLGGRVYAVEPRHLSLEDRFLQLLGEKDS